MQDILPGINAGIGMPVNVTLSDQGQGITANATSLDRFHVPAAFKADVHNVVMRAVGMTCEINDLGSGATSGTWNVKLVKNDDATNGVIGTGKIVYNASGTGLSVAVDLRDAFGNGYALVAGDVLRLDLDVATTSGSLSGGAKGVKCHVMLEAYGVIG